MTTEEDFQRLLDADPLDFQTRLMLSDFLRDHDDPRADGYAALGWLMCFPQKAVGDYYREDGLNWAWQSTVTGRSYRTHLKSYWHSQLTLTWIDAPPGFHHSWAGWRTMYKSRQDADNDAALAWLKVPENRRIRDLREAMSR